MIRRLIILVGLTLVLLTAGCGNKGPLYLPEDVAELVEDFSQITRVEFEVQDPDDEELAAFEVGEDEDGAAATREPRPAARYRAGGLAWIAVGAAFLAWIVISGLDKQLYILAIGAMTFGGLQLVTGSMQTAGRTDNGLYHIVEDLFAMPRVMKQLAVVQFFSWFALFAMWIYSTAAVTSHHFGSSDVTSAAYNEGANWVGVLFAAYNGFAALAALFVASPWIAWQAWRFVSPGLYRREKLWAVPFVFAVSLFFMAGGVFAYLVAFPFAVEFLLGMGAAWDAQIAADRGHPEDRLAPTHPGGLRGQQRPDDAGARRPHRDAARLRAPEPGHQDDQQKREAADFLWSRRDKQQRREAAATVCGKGEYTHSLHHARAFRPALRSPVESGNDGNARHR